MKWDEVTYGLEYDLDLFNIVAVDDFNMGAMENKSLNIFNSRLVLATPDTASDFDFGRIEGVIAHEFAPPDFSSRKNITLQSGTSTTGLATVSRAATGFSSRSKRALPSIA
jgi:hypothetical protein